MSCDYTWSAYERAFDYYSDMDNQELFEHLSEAVEGEKNTPTVITQVAKLISYAGPTADITESALYDRAAVFFRHNPDAMLPTGLWETIVFWLTDRKVRLESL